MIGSPSNPLHRGLRFVFKYTGVQFVFGLLNDRAWAAAVIAALGLAAGGTQLAAGKALFCIVLLHGQTELESGTLVAAHAVGWMLN